MLLQEYISGSLRPCAYWARTFNDCEIRYSAYDREALAVVDAVSRVWRVYLLGCKNFSVVTDHATLAHLLKQSSDRLTDRQVQWVERSMPFAQNMSIFYKKESVNVPDPVSRRPAFFHPDDVQMHMPAEMFALWLNDEVPNMCYQNNDTTLLVLLADTISADDDFLSQLKSAYSSCPYFSDEIKARWKDHGLIIKSSDGLYTYHDFAFWHRPRGLGPVEPRLLDRGR